MSKQSKVEPDPLAVLEEVFKKLKIDNPDLLDPTLLDALPFTSAKPKKWPSWTDLDIVSAKQGNPNNRNEVIKAIHDLCSKVEVMLDRPACTTALGPERADLHRMKVTGIKKKLALLEDALTPPNPWPLFTALEDVSKRLHTIDPNNVDLRILDAFAFQGGKPGLFTTWTDLDLTAGTTGTPGNRSAVIVALRDLMSKAELMLNRPACQRTLDSSVIEKYKAMLISITEKLSLLGDSLSPPNPQPMLSVLEEVHRRFESFDTTDQSILDSFSFRPGKPGLFTAWTDLDLPDGNGGDPTNRGAVIMALRDLLAKFDRTLDRPSCQKALGETAIETYRSMRVAIGKKVDQCTNAIPLSNPTLSQEIPPSAATEPPLIVAQLTHEAPQPPQEHELINNIKRRIGNRPSIWQPTLFSRAAWAEAGAIAGIAMIVALLFAIPFPFLIIAVPIVGKAAIAFSFIQRKKRVSATIKQCRLAEDLYKKASSNNDILNIFSLLTSHAQAQFLVWLGSEFRELVVQRHVGLKPLCLQIDSFFSTPPESLERANARATFPRDGLGEEVFNALIEKEKGSVC